MIAFDHANGIWRKTYNAGVWSDWETIPLLYKVSGSPEGVITSPIGAFCLNTGSGSVLYIKKTGSGNTGWVAV